MYIEKTDNNYTRIASHCIDSLCQGISCDTDSTGILYTEQAFDHPVFSFSSINSFESIFGSGAGSGMNSPDNEYRMSNIFSDLTCLTTTVM